MGFICTSFKICLICFQEERDIDLSAIDDRLRTLHHQQQSKQSIRKRNSLEQKFMGFLQALPHSPSISEASPKDVCRFLVWCDTSGKTKLHDNDCYFIGQNQCNLCGCKTVQSSGTVAVMVTRLGHIFRKYGKEDKWNDILSLGNPVFSPLVKEYVTAVKEEQARARILPKQTKPMFIGKVRSIASFIGDQLQCSDLHCSLRERYTLLRDQAMFKLQFFAGDRASDISNILVQEVKEIPDKSGYVFSHTYSKTLRGGDGKSNIFIIKRCKDSLICPIFALEQYFLGSSNLGLNLATGFLFRLVTEGGRVLDAPVTYSAMYERLKFYLKILGIDEGETPHSLRAGCAITLAIGGGKVQADGIMSHIGWSGTKMADYYSRATQLKDARSTGEQLSLLVSNNEVESIFRQFGDFSNFRNPILK